MEIFKKLTFTLFIVTLLYVFIYKLWLFQVPEWFQLAYELGEISYGLALAYVTSFIFYLLVTLLPQNKQRKNVYKYVKYKVELINKNFNDILELTLLTEDDISYLNKEISKEEYNSSFDINNYPRNRDYHNISSQEIIDFFNRIEYGGVAPLSKIGDSEEDMLVTWGEYLTENANITNKLVSEILVLIPFLDTRHITILCKIQDSPYFYRIKDLNPEDYNNKKLGFLAKHYIEYYEVIRELSEELSLSLNNITR